MTVNQNATLTWLDLTSADRDKTRRLIDLFREQGTVDELGLGSLRDTFSDALFPGTSVLNTRLRYFLFVPWLYQQLEAGAQGRDIAGRARESEIKLIDALGEAGESGVIGIEAREELNRLPSTVYWAGLVRWGIFRAGRSQGWYHTHFNSLVHRRSREARPDDPGAQLEVEHTWNPHLPTAPERFPEHADFRITHEEAVFLQDCLATYCKGSLLAWMAVEGKGAPSESLWEDPVAWGAPAGVRRTLELARRFSLVMEGAPLYYNLMLAERRYELEASTGDQKRMDGYRRDFLTWAETASDDLAGFPCEELWAFAARRGMRQRLPQQRFVEQWIQQVAELGGEAALDSAHLRRLIEDREVTLKRGRARLTNRGRLLDWRGDVGIGRMQFRWPQVRRMLMDLYEGLGR